ncbi:hypothetical protein PIB30_039656 [Stylosanthes scabra]|uniref:Cyclic nucleotide-binding domain-containing protein n=1 Tax=Stylosanthes scabra TaxID=79078 RepID=A0ABU6UG35_9FABA|nr:hypothetical protein [Stylosanthes scabra]
MDNHQVIQFLGCVPLLQRLPTSSVRKISQLLLVKHYEEAEYVAREGEPGDGVYFIWEGEAEVVGSVKDNDEIRPQFQLKRYDYFGYGFSNPVHQTDVIALSKLTCLVLPQEHLALLQPKSIWSAQKSIRTCSTVEDILHLEPMEALAAASKSVDFAKLVHSLHAYFILPGDLHMPIVYKVDRLRDGKSFASRRVDAIQKGNIVFTLLASFQKEELGFDHQEVAMPSVPTPDKLLSMEELRERRLTDPRLPKTYRNKIATAKFIPWPIEIRFCEPSTSTNQTKSPPSLNFWFRAKGKLSDDQALHRCVVAYVSDLIFLQVTLNPHRKQGMKASSLSLDHAMWFHRPVIADDWILYVIFSPSAYNARGIVTGQMFNQKRELLASLVQEGLIRKVKGQTSATKSKL